MGHGGTGALPTQELPADQISVQHMFSSKPPTTGLFTDHLPGTPGEKWETAVKILEWISKHMVRRGSTIDDSLENDSIPSGYTYLGQLITHDITFTAEPLPVDGTNRGNSTSLSTPKLDLDCIYRGGPKTSPWLYNPERNSRHDSHSKRLHLGSTRDGERDGPNDKMEDLPRVCLNGKFSNLRNTKEHGKKITKIPLYETLIGDHRNQDNLILSQFVVLFHKLHNRFIDFLESHNSNTNYHQQFTAARKFTLRLYHNVIREDFLPKLLDPDVCKSFQQKTSLSEFAHATKFDGSSAPEDLPIEFTMAAMRIGHAMVRQRYTYSKSLSERPSTADLLDFRFGTDLMKIPIERRWIIDWRRFFNTEKGVSPDPSRKIVAAIAPDLANNARFPSDDHSASPDKRGGLIFRDFVRGLGNRLPTAQSIISQYGLKSEHQILPCKLTKFFENWFKYDDIDKALSVCKNTRKTYLEYISTSTPLLLYILTESEATQNYGSNLGKLGSNIIADVIYPALLSSKIEFSHTEKQIWNDLFNSKCEPATMSDLINFVDSPSY